MNYSCSLNKLVAQSAGVSPAKRDTVSSRR